MVEVKKRTIVREERVGGVAREVGSGEREEGGEEGRKGKLVSSTR